MDQTKSMEIWTRIFVLLTMLISVHPGASAVELAWPLDCTPGDNRCFPESAIGYPDIDNDGVAFNCGAPGYTGHTGTDIGITQSGVVQGTDVLAAEAGEVLWVFDGKYDSCPSNHPDCAAPPTNWFVPGQSNGYRVCTVLGDFCPGGGSGCFWCFDGGNVVVIKHPQSTGVFATRYDHLKRSSILVAPGDTVQKGEKIAEAASAGNSTGAHLHFEVWKDTYYDVVDPWAGSCGTNTGSSYWENDPPWSSGATCNGKTITVDLNIGQSTTSGDDVVLGTPGPDVIKGKAGNDTICGMGGDDFIHGNSGDDWIDGGEGVDNLRGGRGSDTIFTGPGATAGTSSRAFGGYDDDFIYGGPDDDDLRGGRGNDTIEGDEGDDEIAGNEDDDIIYGDGGNDIIKGGNGENDVLFGGAGTDSLNGGAGANDFCDGGGGAADTVANCEF